MTLGPRSVGLRRALGHRYSYGKVLFIRVHVRRGSRARGAERFDGSGLDAGPAMSLIFLKVPSLHFELSAYRYEVSCHA